MNQIFEGKVMKGLAYGRKLGFPTANIELKKIVAPGIYAGFTTLDRKIWLSAIYVGKARPDVLETHLIDFAGDLYDKEISVEIGEKIRDEIEAPEEILRKTIAEDIKKVKNLIYSPNANQKQ